MTAEHTHDTCQLRVRDLNVTISGHMILEDVAFDAACGEILAIIGPNGAGKSTLLRALLGLQRYSGSITFPHTGERPQCGYVPQQLPFDPMTPLTVRDLFAAALQRKPVWWGRGKSVTSITQRALERVEGLHLFKRQLGKLSGGELQRVMLALALEPLPGLLLLDEPVSGVDARGNRMFYGLVDRLRNEWELAVLLVSHDLGPVERFADRVVLLDSRVRAAGSPAEVMGTDAFLACFGGGDNV